MNVLLIRTGGLANQYFQIIAGLVISRQLQKDLHVIDIGLISRYKINQSKENFTFHHSLKNSRATYLKPMNSTLHFLAGNHHIRSIFNLLGIIISNGTNDDLSWAKIRRNTWLVSGNFQNDNFFNQIEEESRIPHNLTNELRVLSKRNPLLGTVIHFRLGDYFLEQNPQGILPVDYYLDALSNSDTPKQSDVYIVSDQPQKALEILATHGLSNDYHFISISASPLEDLAALISARNLICANSSFSLMAALLNKNDGQIFVPSPFYKEAEFELEAFHQKWTFIDITF